MAKELHGKYKFTARQTEDIKDFSPMFDADIADRCGFPKKRTAWPVRRLF
jgi:hypothetical protein